MQKGAFCDFKALRLINFWNIFVPLTEFLWDSVQIPNVEKVNFEQLWVQIAYTRLQQGSLRRHIFRVQNADI